MTVADESLRRRVPQHELAPASATMTPSRMLSRMDWRVRAWSRQASTDRASCSARCSATALRSATRCSRIRLSSSSARCDLLALSDHGGQGQSRQRQHAHEDLEQQEAQSGSFRPGMGRTPVPCPRLAMAATKQIAAVVPRRPKRNAAQIRIGKAR